jgi:peptidoglycan/LPS O-acetylase OafA/YrhL
MPILVTMLFVGFLVAVASVSYYLIEKPGQELFAGLARWLHRRVAQERVRSLGSAPSVGATR